VALLWCKHLLLNRKKITGEKLWKPQHEIVMPLLSVSGTPYFGGKSMHEQSRSFEFQPPNQYGMSVIQRNDAIQFDLSMPQLSVTIYIQNNKHQQNSSYSFLLFSIY
jgi:hypothetical protein